MYRTVTQRLHLLLIILIAVVVICLVKLDVMIPTIYSQDTTQAIQVSDYLNTIDWPMIKDKWWEGESFTSR